jgi:hypothetical protein
MRALFGLAVLCAAVLAAATQAFAIFQTPKNGCTSPIAYSGARTSPAFTPPVGAAPPTLSFQGWYEIEAVNTARRDQITVQQKPVGQATWQTLATLNAGAPEGGAPDQSWSNNGAGAAPSFQSFGGYSLPAGQQIQVRFVFDTGDSFYQGFRGVGIDNVTAAGLATQNFDGGLGAWSADGPNAAGAPSWQVPSDPGSINVKSPEVSPELVTLPGTSLPSNGTRYAWFGETASGTYCGPDFAQRTSNAPLRISDLSKPQVGVDTNIEPVKGDVFVAVPKGSAAAAGRAHASQKGLKFVPLEEARQVPIGSFLDTRKGTVRVQSATGTRNRTQQGTFASGLFQVLQSRKKRAKGLTKLVLKGANFRSCRARGSSRAQAALSRRALRRLRGSARGRFSTSGRYSAATVRGTKWTVTDRCDGTLTTVSRGKVAVRDFRRRKTVLVRTGKRYLAKAPG